LHILILIPANLFSRFASFSLYAASFRSVPLNLPACFCHYAGRSLLSVCEKARPVFLFFVSNLSLFVKNACHNPGFDV
jgi:hypothetical protein